jgi:hypothetical protein
MTEVKKDMKLNLDIVTLLRRFRSFGMALSFNHDLISLKMIAHRA